MQVNKDMNSLHDIDCPDFLAKDEDTNILDLFYRPCIKKSNRYDRLSGYFSSMVFTLSQNEFYDFFNRGGRIRVICSPYLSEEDKNAIVEKEKTYKCEEVSLSILLDNDATKNSAKIFSYLFNNGLVDVRIAEFDGENALVHDKIGIFYDSQDNKISFNGSINETKKGWNAKTGNSESFDVFKSWIPNDIKRIENHELRFLSYWRDQVSGITVRPPSSAFSKMTQQHADEGSKIFHKKNKPIKSDQSFPYIPRDYQIDVLESWKSKGRSGLVKFCTGAGKTVVGMLVVKWAIERKIPVLIFVPGKTLMYQWSDDLKKCFSNIDLMLCGDGHRQWKNKYAIEGMLDSEFQQTARIILSTFETAVNPYFLKRVLRYTEFLIIADEVHNLGAPKLSNLLTLDAAYRLGLSATPERYNDKNGTKKILDFFGEILEPSIDIPTAIKKKMLVPYNYFVEPIYMTENEQDDYDSLSKRISKLYAQLKNNKEKKVNLTNKIELLTIQRSRIAKKASAKIEIAVDIIKDNFVDGQRWLFFVEDSDQLNEIKNSLNLIGHSPMTYDGNSSTDNRRAIIEYLDLNGGVILSMKCLDEGVDIPSISHAVIISSSKNPREFVQRRGRVLRKCGEKKKRAYIWDLITFPNLRSREPNSLIISEVIRAKEFASYAENYSIRSKINTIISKYDLSLDDIVESEEILEEENDC